MKNINTSVEEAKTSVSILVDAFKGTKLAKGVPDLTTSTYTEHARKEFDFANKRVVIGSSDCVEEEVLKLLKVFDEHEHHLESIEAVTRLFFVNG